MFCPRCGKELEAGANVCRYCGAVVDGNAQPFSGSYNGGNPPPSGASYSGGNTPPSGASYSGGNPPPSGASYSGGNTPPSGASYSGGNPPPSGASYSGGNPPPSGASYNGGNPPPFEPSHDGGGNEGVLKICSIVFLSLFGLFAGYKLFGTLRSVFNLVGFFAESFGYISYYSPVVYLRWLADIFLSLLQAVALLLGMAGQYAIYKRWSKENARDLFLLNTACGVLVLAVLLIGRVFALLNGWQFFHTEILLNALLPIASVAVLGMFLMGAGFDVSGWFQDPALMENCKNACLRVMEFITGNAAPKSRSAAGGGASAQPSNAQPYGTAQQPYGAAQQPYGSPYGQPYAPMRLKEDRSLIVYILLTILTCGIYSWFFIYSWAKDVNTACAGDGKETAGLLKLIVFSLLTCGIYAYVWYYNLGDRLQSNGPRYGQIIPENGGTVILWMIFGSLLCGIGPLVALHILFKNTNLICASYNRSHNM